MLDGVESGVVRLSRSVPTDEVHEGTGPTERRVDTRLIRRCREIDYSTVVGSDDKVGERRPRSCQSMVATAVSLGCADKSTPTVRTGAQSPIARF